ncbi:LysM peptidoglycan-binding domain-containing protein [Aeromonas sp. Y318-1]|uniref:LysM peptidoglycan-binding domain-containing protein n=1 Tax=Aeromonas TaxID=642 RepID=UPI0022E1066A|nr:LysM peptidoglycan-binding domain-containing protein [Aeromonas sp. Y318-1]
MKFKPSKVYQVVWTYLFLGQQALFPVAYAAEQLAKPTSEQPEVIRYQVAKGDTLGSVSRRFGVAPHQLLVLNHHLTPEAPYLVVGDTINVPRTQSLPTLAGENPLHLKEDKASAINVEQKVAQHAARLGQAFSASDEVGALVGAENESEIVKGARRAQRNSIAASGELESTSAPSHGAKQEAQYWRQQLATQFEEEANAYATSLLGGMGTARTRMTLKQGNMNLTEIFNIFPPVCAVDHSADGE